MFIFGTLWLCGIECGDACVLCVIACLLFAISFLSALDSNDTESIEEGKVSGYQEEVEHNEYLFYKRWLGTSQPRQAIYLTHTWILLRHYALFYSYSYYYALFFLYC
jgi:hypothetical protein